MIYVHGRETRDHALSTPSFSNETLAVDSPAARAKNRRDYSWSRCETCQNTKGANPRIEGKCSLLKEGVKRGVVVLLTLRIGSVTHAHAQEEETFCSKEVRSYIAGEYKITQLLQILHLIHIWIGTHLGKLANYHVWTWQRRQRSGKGRRQASQEDPS